MPSNQIWTNFNPTELSPLSGPTELIECLLNGRRAGGSINTSHVSDEELRNLIRIAFNASLMPDEGRFPRFQLAAHWGSIAALTQADGCVVLSPELDILGAGGEILTSDAEAASSPVAFTCIRTSDPWPDQTGADLGGTRHRSALRLCKAVPTFPCVRRFPRWRSVNVLEYERSSSLPSRAYC